MLYRHLRERSFTALVVLEATAFFILVPFAAKTSVPIVLEGLLAAAIAVVAVIVVWGSRAATIALLFSASLEIAALVLRVEHPSERTEALDFAAALVFLLTLSVVVGIAVFGPGKVTVHRILGAIAIYLNVAAAFALLYRVIAAFTAGAFTGKSVSLTQHSIDSLLYFSLSTLTTSGYGDIVPVDPLARSAASLEAVIGQLFPTTLLARLITLELEARRDIKAADFLARPIEQS